MRGVASVDVGSNTVRLMVGEREGEGSFEVVERMQVITRLGEGMGEGRTLRAAAIGRTVDALAMFRKRWEELGASRYRAVATSAVREAQNAGEFIESARDAGVTVDVISGTEEARLVMDGLTRTVRMDDGELIVVDIGGGSTEFIHVRGGDIRDIISTDLGVVRLTEAVLKNDPPTQEELRRLAKVVEKEVDLVYNRFSIARTPLRLLGTAGTVTSLAAIEKGLSAYDPDRVEGSLFSYQFICRILKEFLVMNGDGRLRKYPVLTKGRQDVIVAGAAILKVIMERFGADELVVSDRGLLEGIIEGLIRSDREQSRRRQLLES